MTTGFVPELRMENRMERQMGCMAGFLQIFDRHQILSGKRLQKRLPAPPVVDTLSEPEILVAALPVSARESGKVKQQIPPSPDRPVQCPAVATATEEFLPEPPIPLLRYELKENTKPLWKTCKDTPRLSLDSKATTDTKGSLHPKEMRSAIESRLSRSPCVIAKLMGLDPLPNCAAESEKKPALRRCSSESGTSRSSFQPRLIVEGSNFQLLRQNQSHSAVITKVATTDGALMDDRGYSDPRNYSSNNVDAELQKISNRSDVNLFPWKAPPHRKSFFDSVDVFPEPKQTVPVYGEIEKRLKTRGINEPIQDLETLKNILEALQLKGLLHSTTKLPEQNQFRHHNFVYEESPIVVMKPSRPSIPSLVHRRGENDFSPSNGRSPSREFRQNYNFIAENSQMFVPSREKNFRRPTQNECTKRPNSLVKPKPLSVETRRRMNELTDNRRSRTSQVNSSGTGRTGRDLTANNRNVRSKKTTAKGYQTENTTPVAGEDESSSISESSMSTSTDTERSKTDGRNLLERCDKLLHSIAEMTTAPDTQPSPVSVLDSPSLYRDDSRTPSPLGHQRKINFKDASLSSEEETWSPVISPIAMKSRETSDSYFLYVSEIIDASNFFLGESDAFLLLEKRQYLKGKDSSNLSRLQRKVVFDTINEILTWIRRLPPWENVNWTNYDGSNPCVSKVWTEFQRIRVRDDSDDVFVDICNVLKKDFNGDTFTGWKDCPTEMSETILDVERSIFKDLISETIRDLAGAALTSISRVPMMSRRKLVYLK